MLNALYGLLFCLFLSVSSFAATSVTQGTSGESGIAGVPTLPGREITSQEMQQHFPKPLGSSAPSLPFIPDAAPLIPALPLEQKSTGDNTVHYPVAPTAPSFSVQPLPMAPAVSGAGGQATKHSAEKSAENSNSTYKSPEQKRLEEHFLRALQPPVTQQESPSSAAAAEVTHGQSTETPSSLLSTENAKVEFPALEVMLGQMILAGFTGLEVERQSPIVKLIGAGKVGGVFLEPVPVQNNKQAPEDLLAMAQSGMGAQQSAEILAQVGVPGNVASAGQVRRLIATLQSFIPQKSLPLWVAVEQEGGAVQALRPDMGFAGLASAARLGQGTVEQTEIVARRAGLEMGGLGINMALGPAGDVNINPLSENIGQRQRSFGTQPSQVTQHVLAFGRGLRAAKVLPCLRNFPGTGSYVRGFAPVASQQGQRNILESIPDISGAWQAQELQPFADAVPALEYAPPQSAVIPATGIATSQSTALFALQPALVYHRGYDAMRPVPLSSVLLQNMVREQWRFEGLILSQDLRAMQPFFSLEESILQSIEAGVDILLISEPPAMVNPASSPLAGLGVLSSLPGMGNIEALAGLMQKNTSPDASEADKSEEALVQMLLQNQAGQMLSGIPGADQIPGLSSLGGAMGAEVKAKPLTGLATQAEKVYANLLQLVRAGRISEARIRQSWLRITKAKQGLGLVAY